MLNFFSNMMFFLEENAAGATDALSEATPVQQFLSILTTFGPIVLIVIAFYFFLIRPQKKQEKEVQKMRDGIAVGDKVTTIGGITGEVRQIKDNISLYVEPAEANTKSP